MPRTRKLTIYTAEVHVCYVQELHLGDKVTVSFQLLDHDDKRLRAYQEIRHVDGWLAATSESLSLHVDMSGPKVAPFPADIAGEGRGDARRPCRPADARARRPLDRHQAQERLTVRFVHLSRMRRRRVNLTEYKGA